MHARLVVAAQNGDRRACDELIAAYLPLLYNIVGRALSGHVDVDDVVQETLLRAVRDLPSLREPDRFRSWLVTIAIRQISAHRHRRRAAADQVVILEEADGAAEFEELTILRLQLSVQRRLIAQASRWLDPEQRLVMSLWWQERAGQLSREEIAAGLGMSVAHTAVRLQRMREQLELCREIVTALAMSPRCERLEASIVDWDGSPAPLWRKRIGRHVRGCAQCLAGMAEPVPIERLLMSHTPLAVPVTLAAAVHRAIGRPARPLTGLPLAAIAASVVLILGPTAAYLIWPQLQRHAPPAVAAPVEPVRPSIATATVPLGVWSLESVAEPGRYLTYTGLFAGLSQVSAGSDDAVKQRATFTVVSGLADADCVTFRAADGRYLRHYELRLRFSADDGTRLFREDATFCPLPGVVAGSVWLQAHNYPDRTIRYQGDGIYIHLVDGTVGRARESSFIMRNPWS